MAHTEFGWPPCERTEVYNGPFLDCIFHVCLGEAVCPRTRMDVILRCVAIWDPPGFEAMCYPPEVSMIQRRPRYKL